MVIPRLRPLAPLLCPPLPPDEDSSHSDTEYIEYLHGVTKICSVNDRDRWHEIISLHYFVHTKEINVKWMYALIHLKLFRSKIINFPLYCFTKKYR